MRLLCRWFSVSSLLLRRWCCGAAPSSLQSSHGDASLSSSPPRLALAPRLCGLGLSGSSSATSSASCSCGPRLGRAERRTPCCCCSCCSCCSDQAPFRVLSCVIGMISAAEASGHLSTDAWGRKGKNSVAIKRCRAASVRATIALSIAALVGLQSGSAAAAAAVRCRVPQLLVLRGGLLYIGAGRCASCRQPLALWRPRPDRCPRVG